MISFHCNICGAYNSVEALATEPASCRCGSNVRIRALIHLLSLELFGKSISLTDFPKVKSIRGLGMSDQLCYARILADKFDYTNTYYDREPRLDFTESHPQLFGTYDFILSSDVIEHIAPPIEHVYQETSHLLKAHGFLVVTVYCNPGGQMREYFPDLHEYRIVPLRGAFVLINRKKDGTIEVRDDLVFHAGAGATLEMREFGATDLRAQLLAAGFRDVSFLVENVPELGIIFDQNVSQPLLARKDPFSLDRCAVSQLIDELQATQNQLCVEQERTARERAGSQALEAKIRAASDSKWMQLGRFLGLGPKI